MQNEWTYWRAKQEVKESTRKRQTSEKVVNERMNQSQRTHTHTTVSHVTNIEWEWELRSSALTASVECLCACVWCESVVIMMQDATKLLFKYCQRNSKPQFVSSLHAPFVFIYTHTHSHTLTSVRVIHVVYDIYRINYVFAWVVHFISITFVRLPALEMSWVITLHQKRIIFHTKWHFLANVVCMLCSNDFDIKAIITDLFTCVAMSKTFPPFTKHSQRTTLCIILYLCLSQYIFLSQLNLYSKGRKFCRFSKF